MPDGERTNPQNAEDATFIYTYFDQLSVDVCYKIYVELKVLHGS